VGQKINPKCFRLGVTQNHLSTWFGNKTSYSDLIIEDFLIRKTLTEIFKQEYVKVSEINIERYKKNEAVILFIFTPTINQLLQINVSKIETALRKKIKANRKFYLVPKVIDDEAKDANLVAAQIVNKLENRFPFKRAMKESIRQSQASEVPGIKIEVSGRLNGIEIARSEWRREGRVPLHTLRARIDYSHQTASTIYGIIGVKVWLFLGESYKNQSTK
jgi:small subunit ribosomal protein S3